MSKQNVVKKYAKVVLFKMISNNSILDEAILRSIIITNEKISILWIMNLFFGETKNFLSEKKPIRNTETKKKLNSRLFEKKNIKGISIKKPPLKGTFPLFEKDWWFSPE